jgi:hypothetical protein
MFYSPFFLFLFANRSRGGRRPAGGFSFGVQGFANPFLLSSTAWTRGGRGAQGRHCQNLSLSLRSSTRHRPRPPVVARRTADTLGAAPPCRDPEPAPHATLAVTMPTEDTPAEPARHRPPPATSPRHRAPPPPI